MLMLSIDSSGKSAAVAVTDGEKLIAGGFENSGYTHSQTLLALVDDTLRHAGVETGDIGEFAVTCGPGSFTGLRIGCALVMGLAGPRPCVAVPTLLALAYNLIDRDGVVIPVLDARCAQVYTAAFRIRSGRVRRIAGDMAVSARSAAGMANELAGKGDSVRILGDGAYLLEGLVTPPVNQEEDKPLITGESVARAAAGLERCSAADLRLSYLRLSQAERERLNKKIE